MHKSVKTIFICGLVSFSAAMTAQTNAAPSNGFTYQGQLKHQDVPVNGEGRFSFTLWDAEVDGRQVGSVVETRTKIVNGLFTAQLDFGPDAFRGEPRWLEIRVATSQGEGRLAPRQPITPAPFALYALDGPGGGGGSVWSTSGSDIYYNGGDVGIGLTTPSFPLHVQGSAAHVIYGINQSSTNFTSGVYGESAGSNGYGVHGNAPAGSGNAIGVFGEAVSAGGRGVYGKVTNANGNWAYGVYGDASGTRARGVFGRNTSPTGTNYGVYGQTESPDGRAVFGNAKAASGPTSGVQGRSVSPDGAAVSGYNDSLTGRAIAVRGQTASPGGFAGYFLGKGHFSGNVGIGTTDPQHALHVTSADSGPVVFAEASGMSSSAFYGFADGSMSGVRGESSGTSGIGVSGKAWAVSGTTAGVKGVSLSPDGRGVEGENRAGGWAGYFQGPTYVSGRLGIGTKTLTADLEVDGTARVTGATAGATLKVVNSGTGIGSHAIFAKLDNPSGNGEAAAGYFSSRGTPNIAISAISDSSLTVYAHNSGYGSAFHGSCAGTGYAFRGSSQGTGAYITGTGNTGSGVHAKATGNYGSAVNAEATGGEGIAVYAHATGVRAIALQARNTSTLPTIDVKNSGTGSMIEARDNANRLIFKVANDGITAVSVLQITGGSDLAEMFDISDEAKPGMVVAIDPQHPGKLCIARGAYNRRVAGVISGANNLNVGMILADLPGAENSLPVALSGRVWVQCDAIEKAIEPGDMLTTAHRAGHAMSVTDYQRAHGAVIGKAMTLLKKGETGMVLVLVNLQ